MAYLARYLEERVGMLDRASFETLQTKQSDRVLYVTLNRPDVHNAFNESLISELTECFKDAAKDDDTRAIVLSGSGKSFCAGADLNWMKKMIGYTRDENVSDSLEMAAMYEAIDKSPKPVIGRINGSAFGGGVGLVAVCDIAVAAEDALFAFSEVKLGIVPAVISRYVIDKIGPSHARALFTTGERFDAERARSIGLVHEVAPADKLDEGVALKLKLLLSSGPRAVTEAKGLVATVPHLDGESATRYTAEKIAELRVSEEGQEGIGAFLEKRKPAWRD